MHDGRRNRGIDPPGKGADYLPVSNLFSDQGNLGLDKRVHGPLRFAAAEPEDEIAQYINADQGVGHFRMKLNGDQGFVLVAQGGEGRVGAHGAGLEAVGDQFHAVAVAHPHLMKGVACLQTGEQPVGI